ncbi:molybdate ABC transporter substrate-binding protein [Bradymonas sediminis]|uniref:Molybdate ABC transporter substrate-binding protein n=1 Tax=Bradymonas sediminis TaxID=1548548 RepID=A0A2Z4FN02_9DELT|nr:molybdate ABC transporter substrate-binding protein [Bradymonas sediminis]AWV90313.1 molybdate ABC transporter substrate-binding protein [Bradymonas sediminis]TDP75712.1 molybdate transport system substrate-binding protein [Bradymonas sediminis]
MNTALPNSSGAASRLARFARLTLVSLVILGGCERPQPGEEAELAAQSSNEELMIFAASSLTEAFHEIADAFEKEQSGVDVTLHFAGSQALRTQIENGAPADVFASANSKHMSALLAKDLVGAPALFAHNRLVIVTPPDNPAGIASAEDLPKAERLVVGADEVPVGMYTQAFLTRAAKSFGGDYREKVERDIVSREANVRLVLTKVSMGEADAGVVYRTDALQRGEQVHTVEIPDALNIRADYPVAVPTQSPRPALAQRWIDFVLSEQGQTILAKQGFGGATQAPDKAP